MGEWLRSLFNKLRLDALAICWLCNGEGGVHIHGLCAPCYERWLVYDFLQFKDENAIFLVEAFSLSNPLIAKWYRFWLNRKDEVFALMILSCWWDRLQPFWDVYGSSHGLFFIEIFPKNDGLLRLMREKFRKTVERGARASSKKIWVLLTLHPEVATPLAMPADTQKGYKIALFG